MQNLSLACRIQESMNTLYPTLARPMTMRSSRYNQQLSNGSLLVEVGTHGNTLQEALAGRGFCPGGGAGAAGAEGVTGGKRKGPAGVCRRGSVLDDQSSTSSTGQWSLPSTSAWMMLSLTRGSRRSDTIK